MSSVKRYPYIDNLYTIGTLFVLLGHSHSSDWSTFSGTLLEKAIVFIYTFHMPLFFFIAGFLFINSHSLENVGYKKWSKEKAIKLLTPYIVLSVAAAVPKYYLEQRTFAGMGSYIIQAVFAPRLGVWGHFWFIPVLMLVYLVFGIWKKFVTVTPITITGTVVVSLVLYFLPIKSYWFGLSDIKTAPLFFTAGMVVCLINRNGGDTQWYGRLMCMIIGVILSTLLVKNYQYNSVLMLVVAFSMIFVCWQMAKLIGEHKITEWISRHNFTIYIYSWPFQAAVMVICGRLHFPWYLTTLCMFIIGLMAPAAMIYIYEHSRKIQNRFFDLVLGSK